MPNKNYVKGRRKEYSIVSKLRKEGFSVVQRTAGSHSLFDVFAIDEKEGVILFVQAKPDSMSDNEKERLRKDLSKYQGIYDVYIDVR